MPSCGCSSPEASGARTRRLAWLIALIVLLASSPARAGDPAHWKSVDYLVDAFIDIALGSEHEVKRRLVRKWTTPIYYALIHQVGDAALHERLIRAHLEHLTKITGHPIAPATTADAANFLVVLTS